MSVRYYCPHLNDPRSPLPPSYPSSSSCFSPLDSLFFCEECDAIRCEQCVADEVASYFCPSCLFEVPGANVRADKNRCARSCFSCPQCESNLAIQGTETQSVAPSSSTQPDSGPPYFLVCPGCKWNSRELGWEFEKPTGLTLQLQKLFTQPEDVQSEFDALKAHFESYVNKSTPTAPPRSQRKPTRNISHLTQMAAKGLHRDGPGLIIPRLKRLAETEKVEWDDLAEYQAKESWKNVGLENGMKDVGVMRTLIGGGTSGVGNLDKVWKRSCGGDRMSRSIHPERISLQTKVIKRCPHPNCRHLLIQPDPKTTRFKIKMVALNYLPIIEVGRRRRNIPGEDAGQPMTAEVTEKRRRERRRTRAGVKEEDQNMELVMHPGEVYTFQLAFTNPLYDPIQIRLTQPRPPKDAPLANHHIHIPTQHFTVAALKDAWAYEDEDEEVEPILGTEGSAGASEDGSISSRRSRASILGAGSIRERKTKDGDVEKRGNISKVVLEVEMLAEPIGPVEFDLEVRYTYRVDDPPPTSDKTVDNRSSAKETKPVKEEYKTFTFWIRLRLGIAEVG